MEINKTIRRYLKIKDEVRFLNSDKKYVIVKILDNNIKIKLTDKFSNRCYTRKEFEEILKTDWYSNKK